jgi:hypothetical protein
LTKSKEVAVEAAMQEWIFEEVQQEEVARKLV